ncbi:MAG: DUF3536 domain-containing protein, partial [Acidobacteriota bacterium]
PECAVDTATLEVAADQGIEYTILAPEQIREIRPLSGGHWEAVSKDTAPTHRPLKVMLPSGRPFYVFVFHGPTSRGIAFEGLLDSSDRLLGAVRGALDALQSDGGMVLISADGETFGHHQRLGQRTLADTLVRARLTGLAQVATVERLLKELPPTHEARLHEPSSWSCPHGVGRWERDCGCAAGGHPDGWSWTWRIELRRAVRMLRDRVFMLVDRRGDELLVDPWAAAEAYGEVLVRPPSPERADALIDAHAAAGLDANKRQRAQALLELICQTLLASTSCGWFFDDVSGIEAVQVMRHAARASELAREVFDIDAEPALLDVLKQAKANAGGVENGAEAYTRYAREPRPPTDALAIHAIKRLASAMDRPAVTGLASSSVGLYAVDELERPQFECLESGHVAVNGRGRVRHLRTGDETEAAFRVASEALAQPVLLEIDGKPVTDPSPAVREELLMLAASRALVVVPHHSREVLASVAWIGRDARFHSIPLPPPFPEALRGGARAVLRSLVSQPPRSLAAAVTGLELALETALASGLASHDLDDLRPALSRLVDSLTGWALTTEAADQIEPLERVLGLCRTVVGERSLSRVRRSLVSRRQDHHKPELVRLARATGLAEGALIPVDTPVRPIRDDMRDTVA